MIKQTVSARKVGYVFGSFLGLIHVVWSILVAIGLAQSLLDASFRFHMFQKTIVVLPFSLSYAVILVGVALIIGYCVGWIFATLWNVIYVS